MTSRAHDDHVITCLLYDGKNIVTASDDGFLKVWLETGDKFSLQGHRGGVWCAELVFPYVISGSTDRTIRVWHLPSRMCLFVLRGHHSTVRCLTVIGNQIVSGSRDGTLRVWRMLMDDLNGENDPSILQPIWVFAEQELKDAYKAAKRDFVFYGHTASVRCVQVNSSYVVSGAYDHQVRVWDLKTGEPVHTLTGHSNRVYCLQFDGRLIASGSLDATIRLWDVVSGSCLHVLKGHLSLISHLLLLPYSQFLVSCNADTTAKVWNIETGEEVFTLSGPAKHTGCVTSAAANKSFVVTSADDGTVKLWDGRTGSFIRDLYTLRSNGVAGSIWSVRCSETKVIIAGGSRNGVEESRMVTIDMAPPTRLFVVRNHQLFHQAMRDKQDPENPLQLIALSNTARSSSLRRSFTFQ